MDLQAHQSDDKSHVILQQVLGLIQRNAAFEVNTKQVHRYLTKYASISGEISKSRLEDLERILHNATALVSETKDLVNKFGGHKGMLQKATEEELLHLHGILSAVEGFYIDYLSQVKTLCQSMWAKFDLNSIFAGISVLFLGVAVVVLTLLDCGVKYSLLSLIPVLGFILASVVTSFNFSFIILIPLFLLCIVVLFLQKVLIEKTKVAVNSLFNKLSMDNIFAVVLCFLQCIALFANSFVVNEDKLIAFFTQALIAVKCVQGLWKCGLTDIRKPILRQGTKRFAKKEHKRVSITGFLLRLLIAWIAFDIVTRTAIVLKACREEQWSCVPSNFLKPLSALTDKNYTASNRFILTVLCAGVIPLSIRQWLRYQGNLNGISFVVLCAKFTLPLAFIFICAHWALQIVPPEMNNVFPEVQLLQQIILPQIVYCLCAATVACLMYSPLCLFTVFKGRKNTFSEKMKSLQDPDDTSKVIHALVQEVKENWEDLDGNKPPLEDDTSTPMVYGLATVYSSALLVLFLAVTLPLMMLLGNGMSLSVFLMCVQIFLLLEIHGLSHDVEPGRIFNSGQSVLLTCRFKS